MVRQSRHPGRRPPEWWVYERNLPIPDIDTPECAVLFEMGELSGAELAALVIEWRRYYDQIQEYPYYTLGPGSILEGDAACAAQYQWAGIPPEYIKKWDAQRAAAIRRIMGKP